MNIYQPLKNMLENVIVYLRLEYEELFLHGLVSNGSKKIFLMNDIDPLDTNEILFASKDFPIDIKFVQCNNLNLVVDREYDLTFIDTFHVYGQLIRELEKFCKFTKKYIIMHDTTVDEISGECIRDGWLTDIPRFIKSTGFTEKELITGLGPAIDEFLIAHPEWYIKERFTNNNGLTVLARRP